MKNMFQTCVLINCYLDMCYLLNVGHEMNFKGLGLYVLRLDRFYLSNSLVGLVLGFVKAI
jgi:hypothetical protein